MAKAESVEMGTIVAPAAIAEAQEADVADPGAVEALKQEQREAQSGKYGSVPTEPVRPVPPEEAAPDEPLTWIEIELVDEDDNPVPGESYRVTTSDNKVATGTLNEKGFARIEYVKPGTCTVTFPRLDQDAWERA
ncbi:MAG: hypothetical protein SFY69_08475 [Planctomycetota bacterium]|nr:hypothetical protein [Planctomycetota bacterium]